MDDASFPKLKGLFHITECENVLSIIKEGIFSRNKLKKENIYFEDRLASSQVISTRNTIEVKGRPLLDYANFYFNPRNPMLTMRRSEINDIAIIQISPEVLYNSDNIVSSGNAASYHTQFEFLPEGLRIVDFETVLKDIVDTSKKNTRRKRMAEVLVPDLVPSSLIQKIHLYSHKWYDYFMQTKSNPEITTKELHSISFTQKSALFDQKTDILLGKDWVKTHSGSIFRVKSTHPVKEIITNVNIIKGNLFNTKINTIVNSVNCVGVMGAGIAFEFRLRYPEMFKEYKEMCDKEEITVGKLWIYNAPDGRKIINFPSKHHWKLPSKYEYLESGLQNFLEIYEKEDIDSVAFPVLGVNKGSLPEKSVLKLMLNYLSNCDIPVEIYTYDEFSGDDIFDKFKEKLTSMSTSEICKATNLRKNYVAKVKEALEDENIRNMRGLGDVKGIGVKTIEKCFKFTRRNQDNSPKWFTDN